MPSRFRFADDANCGDFTLLFCIGRVRNVQSFKTYVLRYCSAGCRRCRGLLKVPGGLARGRERHFRTGKRADNLDTTLFRLPVLVLPFSPSNSGRHFAGFPVAIKIPRICVNCALINEIMLSGIVVIVVLTVIKKCSAN